MCSSLLTVVVYCSCDITLFYRRKHEDGGVRQEAISIISACEVSSNAILALGFQSTCSLVNVIYTFRGRGRVKQWKDVPLGLFNKLLLIFGTDRSERARYEKHVESLAAAVNTVYYNARTQVGI